MPPTRNEPVATRCSRRPRNALERAVVKSMPAHLIPDEWFPNDDELDVLARVLDCEPSLYRQECHRSLDELFAAAGRDTIDVVGMKPSAGDAVKTISIPNSDLSLRFWNGGLTAQSQVFFDFINKHTRRAVNCPDTSRIYTDYPAVRTPRAGRRAKCVLQSWEAGFHVQKKDIPEGEERFCETQGKLCCLQRSGQADFRFKIPRIIIPPAAPPSIAQAIDDVA